MEPSIMVGMNFAHLFLGLHNLYIHLSIFFSHFLSYFNDSMSYDVINDDISYWAHGPFAHQVSLRYLEKWANFFNYYYYSYNNREDETTQKLNPIPL